MHKDKDKNNLLTVLKAIQDEQSRNEEKLLVRLPVNNENGLAYIPYQDLMYILQQLHQENKIFLYNTIPFSRYVLDEQNEKDFLLFITNNNDYSHPKFPVPPAGLFPKGYLEQKKGYLNPRTLIDTLSTDKSGNKNRELLETVLNTPEYTIDNYPLALLFSPTLTQTIFKASKEKRNKYTKCIRNCIKTINIHIKPLGYVLRCKGGHTFLEKYEKVRNRT